MTTTTELHPVPFSVPAEARSAATHELNAWLVDLIALGLRLKQAHWNLRGARFKSVHEQLDEILVDVRNAVDDVAERVVTIGGAADGRPRIIGEKLTLPEFPGGRLRVSDAIRACCGDLSEVIQRGRAAQPKLAEQDPVSEDLVIGVLAALEKHHWMLHSQEEPA